MQKIFENGLIVNWRNTQLLAFQSKREFHFEFLHRRITTNDFLSIICLKRTLVLFAKKKCCSFCKEATLTHFCGIETILKYLGGNIKDTSFLAALSFGVTPYFPHCKPQQYLTYLQTCIHKAKIWTQWKSKTNCKWLQSHLTDLNFRAFM